MLVLLPRQQRLWPSWYTRHHRIVDGIFVGVECKADKKKQPTQLQVQCGEQIEAAGGKWFLVRGADELEALEAYIRLR